MTLYIVKLKIAKEHPKCERATLQMRNFYYFTLTVGTADIPGIILYPVISSLKTIFTGILCTINDLLEQEKLLTSLKEEYNRHLETREVLTSSLKVYSANANSEILRNKYDEIKTLDNLPTEYNSDIITNRPDYLQEETNLKKIGFDVRVAKREFLPTFTIFGQAGLSAYHLGSLFNSPSQFFNAGILPNWDSFSGGRKRAFLRLKKYQYEQALNDYQQTFLAGIKEVNTGVIEYKTSLKNYKEAEKRYEFENKIYNLAKDKKQIGAASGLDLLFAKEALLISEKAKVSNKIIL